MIPQHTRTYNSMTTKNVKEGRKEVSKANLVANGGQKEGGNERRKEVLKSEDILRSKGLTTHVVGVF